MGVLSEIGIDEERLTEIMKIQDKSLKWFYDNLKEIKDSYSGKFIAIYKEEIVHFDEERVRLFQKLKEKYDDTEIEEIFVDYVNSKGYVLILSLNRN